MVYTQNGILFSHKKGDLAIWDNMDGLWGHYTKWNKSERERQILYHLTYMWNLRKRTDRCREQIGGCQRQEVGVGKIGEGGQKVQTSVIK